VDLRGGDEAIELEEPRAEAERRIARRDVPLVPVRARIFEHEEPHEIGVHGDREPVEHADLAVGREEELVVRADRERLSVAIEVAPAREPLEPDLRVAVPLLGRPRSGGRASRRDEEDRDGEEERDRAAHGVLYAARPTRSSSRAPNERLRGEHLRRGAYSPRRRRFGQSRRDSLASARGLRERPLGKTRRAQTRAHVVRLFWG
jgi:hypothetical protein